MTSTTIAYVRVALLVCISTAVAATLADMPRLASFSLVIGCGLWFFDLWGPDDR